MVVDITEIAKEFKLQESFKFNVADIENKIDNEFKTHCLNYLQREEDDKRHGLPNFKIQVHQAIPAWILDEVATRYFEYSCGILNLTYDYIYDTNLLDSILEKLLLKKKSKPKATIISIYRNPIG